VVVLSNLGQSAEIDKALGLGAKDYVVKANIDLDGLVGLVKSKYLPQ
jgi:DNA-binding NarL/FixJ family response regulator